MRITNSAEMYQGNSETKTVLNLFLEQSERFPNQVAVRYGKSCLTYKELDVFSNQFANYLIENCKVSNGDLVGLMLNRNEWLVVAILAIIKTGAAYVPIDKKYPQKRQDFIINDCKCNTIIDSVLLDDFCSKQESYSSNLPKNSTVNSNNLIYIIYTSGTTGNPKGVMIEHGSVVNLIWSQTRLFGIDPTEKIVQFSNYFFDASVEQLFLALLNGATLCIIDKKDLANHELPKFLQENEITHLHATPSYLETLPDLSKLKSLKRVIAGGETCSLKLAEKFGAYCDFYNEYGPTETTVTSTVYKYSANDKQNISLTIGKPIENTEVYILSDTLEIQPIGEVGELCISGNGLARGYLNQEKLTSEKFIDNPFKSNAKLYKTGDHARLLEDGNIEFIGRVDDQVKIRGYRIELGEIETVINALPSVIRAVVIASEHLGHEKRIIAYIQEEKNNNVEKSLRDQLLDVLPEYMVPTVYIQVDDFPKTSTGKIDKKNLPKPINSRPESAPLLKKPKTKSEKEIVNIWNNVLGISDIGVTDNFFEMGGTSLLTQKVCLLINEKLNFNFPVTKIYQYPTISGLLENLDVNKKKSVLVKPKRKRRDHKTRDIAVIAMAGKFPGANSIEELWDVLKEGKETISFFTPEELDSSLPENLIKDPSYVAARGVIPSVNTFDCKFFGLNPKVAQAMDPQQRLFLEIAWEALEKSGYLPKHYSGSVGVYAGVNTNSYFVNNVFPNKELMAQVGSTQAQTLNDKDYIASRAAYHLNLTGPAVSVHSACSTSLLAIAEAVEAIRNGQCDVALAGGSSVTSPINSGHLYQEGAIFNADGHTRSFDADASGTVFSDGAGIVLLKDLEEAKADGDTIFGVIKGIGLNNDGGNKGSFTAPSSEGQAGAISIAFFDADINPSEISYVEAHGTATPIGDPIEIEGLKLAFGNQPVNGYCAIGSVKSNMGHLTAAAGVTGMIKTILSLRNKQIPASLGFNKPNPAIDFENSPFYVNNTLSSWDSKETRKAGVSSFGVGGTNVHIIVEEYKEEIKEFSASRPLQILTWSAKTQNSLDAYQEVLGDYLKVDSNFSLADVASSLSNTRDSLKHRSFSIAGELVEAKDNLLIENANKIKTNILNVTPSELAFLFPGQGAQYLQMGSALYAEEITFKEAVDQCADLLKKYLKEDIRDIIYPKENSLEAERKLKDTKYTQPALFVIEYALSQLWMSWGIKPTLLCGHSVGEFVAAHLAGIFSLEDALHLITMRGKLVSELPGGSMLSIRSNIDDVRNLIPENLSTAAVNSDHLFVVSGEDDAIKDFAKVLDLEGIANKLLLTSHAFHSTMMEPVLHVFEAEVKKVTLNIPRLPMVSTVSGNWLTDEEATSVTYWTNHLRATVNFSGAMETVLKLEDPVLLEVGPGRALTTLSKQKKGLKSLAAISCLSFPKYNQTAYHTVLSALGDLWIHGVEPDWKAFYKDELRQKVLLPSYVFDRKPCWVEPVEITSSVTSTNTTKNIEDQPVVLPSNIKNTFMRKTILLNKISEIIEDNSGIEIESNSYNQSFLELGLDSLVLTQMAISFKNEFNTAITFRQLNNDLGSPNLLAEYVDKVLPKEAYAPTMQAPAASVQVPAGNAMQNANMHQPVHNVGSANQNTALGLMAQQLQLLGKQIELLQGNTATVAPVSEVTEPKPVMIAAPVIVEAKTNDVLTEKEKKEHQKPFGASPRIEKKSTGLNGVQKNFIERLTQNYNSKTAASKAYSQKHRKHMSDPRVVSGFKPETKELIYPIVVEKSSGNRLWDLDGNEYLDALNGFGSCLFGHQPDFIKEALHNQIDQGFEVGPQHPLAGEVCELLCEMTGHERAALCNTGSEAVLGAMRIARTVTGRSLIVAFSTSYHGINDEVIVRGSRKLKTFPAASGIMPEAVQNMLILDYGTEESLKIIKDRAHELAAVLVEPIQSRRPEFQPVDFLKEVREITKAANTTLIFDEIITGFRMHNGGTQELFGIRADIATYGKVIGGGISIGAILGGEKYLDALDGGFWAYGDQSFPEVGVTYFAGTFVRHPLALATTKASLNFFKEDGGKLQSRLSSMTDFLATELNAEFKNKNLPIEVVYYGSLWRIKFLKDIPYSELLFVLLRQKGIHIWDGFPCYLTAAYEQEDLVNIIKSVKESISELMEVGVLKSSVAEKVVYINEKKSKELNQPPVPGARLGMDEFGNPAWFVENDNKNGGFKKIEM